YQYDLNAPGAASQLRLTSTRDLNLNVSVYNANMIIQAYASWNNLSHVHEYHATRETFSPSSGGRSIIGIHHKRNYYIIPKNILGQDIFIRATELRGLTNIIRMPSGDMKPLKVPVSKNMLDSHFKGKLCKKVGTVVIVAIADAQFPRIRGLTSPQYTVAIRLTPDISVASESVLHQQSARTCGSSSDPLSTERELVNWNEVFFFKVDSPEHYTVELIMTDIGKGVPVGFFSAPLNQMAQNFEENPDNEIQGKDYRESCGRVRCCILISARSEPENIEQSAISNQRSGFIQISPSKEGPWTTVRLNYAAPAACWRLGNDVVASEVSVKDGNRYVSIRSLVSVSNATEFALELCLVSQASRENNAASDPEGLQIDFKKEICIGTLRPGDTVPLPLSALKQSGVYVLRLRPCKLSNPTEYAWSSVVDKLDQSEDPSCPYLPEGIIVSSLSESEVLLYCTEISGTSSSGSQKFWFSVSIQATEIAKDIRSDPIQDWNLLVKSPLSITNFLPLMAEFSVLEMLTNGNFVVCSRGVFGPGKTLNVHNADIRNPLFFSLLPNRGWLPAHEAVLLSHPSEDPSKTISLRSSISGRIVQIILEQNFDKEHLLHAKIVRVYAPYWFEIARCPSLTCRLIDITGKSHTRKFSVPFHSKKNNEVIVGEIVEEEMHEGHTIASALKFKLLGLAVSISQSGKDHFGPVKDLSPLGDMDGALDLFAFDEEGNCMQLFITTKSCPFSSVPTKVISIRPFTTFTNRVGQDISIKLSSQDEPKVLRASDSRVSFSYRQSGGPDKLQVRMEGTNWSFPVQIIKEDTIFFPLRRHDGSRTFLRTEIRGYEEGSRFIIVFRLGSTTGLIRVENRTRTKTISIRQSGFDEDSWIHIEPLSTSNFAWEDPYGQKFVDAKVNNGSGVGVWKLDLERVGLHAAQNEELGLQFRVVEMVDMKVVWFTDERDSASNASEEIRCLPLAGKWEHSYTQTKIQNNTSPTELIVELGLIGVSIIDHRPKELSYIYLERVFITYSTGYDGGTTSRFKLILGHLQLDNQLPLTLMPVLLAPEAVSGMYNPVFKMTITMRNENTDGIQVTERTWRFNIHEPIIWALVDFYNNLYLDRLPKSSSVIEVDPEIHISLIDVSEVRIKLSLETAPAQRPHGILGVWSPILSAVGNAFKIQVHLRRVMHKDRFMRRSSISSAIANRIWRDLIHNPLHLIFSVDVLGMTSSTLASLSKGFAELSTDGQFLQLRSKQVWSRRITGVGDGIIQGTEALAQGVAFGVSGVVKRPVESARQNGLLGLAHGLGQAFVGFFAQPVSGALDFFSLTVDGIGASCSRCLEALNSKTTFERVRNPRAVHSDCILREYCEREALGQMVLYLAEASRHFGCTEIFKEPSKFAWSDYYEEHFVVPHQKIVLVTNKRVMLLQCQASDKLDKKPCKIMWDVPWEELLALELAKAGCDQPSHLIFHLKNFRRSEKFVRVIKCSIGEELGRSEPQAIRICTIVRKMWKTHQSDMKSLILKVPSSQRSVHFAWSEADRRELRSSKSIIRSRELASYSLASDERRFVKHSINFLKIWSSERELNSRCTLSKKQDLEYGGMCSIWRPLCPDGYVSVGDIARIGSHPPNVAAVYLNIDRLFALPVGYDLVWRNCLDDYITPVSIWLPRAPEGYFSPGCIAVASFEEPEPNAVYCMSESLTEETEFEEQKVWSAPDSYPWACHIYQVKSDALHFVALRQSKEESDWKPTRVLDDPQPILQSLKAQ
ncbi:Vacuolar protein sorting-associated protein, partial [Parasponia andersonii]